MKNNTPKLTAARRNIARLDWLDYRQTGPGGTAMRIDRRLLAAIGRFLPDGESGVGAELAAHARQSLSGLGGQVENPAQVEWLVSFNGRHEATVFFVSVDGRLYASAEPLHPF